MRRLGVSRRYIAFCTSPPSRTLPILFYFLLWRVYPHNALLFGIWLNSFFTVVVVRLAKGDIYAMRAGLIREFAEREKVRFYGS
ncbi:hypothetical protein CY34DRAFT_141056 [Suillus luteus UH-Slu-Lm8-n1]|uniref:Uncharacterized protein n=1 Tax=Suillus luteus UH-Slu-Lm8-n1 TaxID=930992 RepID=A0A0D0AXC5_9AGAM|nr:hypothetical protein CY34DRAFT_141056 [Suillus luteus UH-Slu-Lm8-n1]